MSDYTIRPNKSIVRKIIFGALQRLSSPEFPLGEYPYIGLGSVSFTDFVEAHHSLGISEMISFERNLSRYHRAEYSKPYSCIRVINGDTRSTIPRLKPAIFNDPALLWLDYEGTIEKSNVLEDIELLCNRLEPGSVVITTINASVSWIDDKAERKDETINEVRRILENSHMSNDMKVDKLKDKIPDKLSTLERRKKYLKKEFEGLVEAEEAKCYTASKINDVYQQAIARKYDKELVDQGRSDIEFRQVFDIGYEDTAPMLVVGGVLVDEDYADHLERSRLWDSPHLQDGDRTMVQVPRLTRKEKVVIDQLLPTSVEDNYVDISRHKKTNMFIFRQFDAESVRSRWGVVRRATSTERLIVDRRFSHVNGLELIQRHLKGLKDEEVEAYATFYDQYPVFEEVRI
jgi:hypothetical protein